MQREGRISTEHYLTKRGLSLKCLDPLDRDPTYVPTQTLKKREGEEEGSPRELGRVPGVSLIVEEEEGGSRGPECPNCNRYGTHSSLSRHGKGTLKEVVDSRPLVRTHTAGTLLTCPLPPVPKGLSSTSTGPHEVPTPPPLTCPPTYTH